MTYAHRNGETEAPTVPGLYWFRGTCELWTGIINLQMALHTIGREGRLLAWEELSQEHLPMQCFAGQWWRPIVPPWEGEAK